jgi:hypothetical protein
MKIVSKGRRAAPPNNGTVDSEPKSRTGSIVAFVIVSLVLVGAFVFVLPYAPNILNGNFLSKFISSISSQSGTTGAQNYTVSNPAILGGSANISYPSDYGTLANYALGQINNDRAKFSGTNITVPSFSTLNSVILSSSSAGQQHADSMIKYGYFSHYDTQGFKPYMRYTLLGGRGAVEENVAYVYRCASISPTGSCLQDAFPSTSSVEGAIASLENAMVYNDSACCGNGHRDNILTALHNRVSIGIAYNGSSLYFVEDFENYYINLNFNFSSSQEVTMAGTPVQAGVSADSIYISFDHTPSPESPAQLNSGPREYGPGTIIGGVLPPCTFNCPQFGQGITVYADTWKMTSSQIDLTFSLQQFTQHYGAGVYTVYLITGSGTESAITSISIFVASV